MKAIVLSADGLAAHWLGAYGSELAETPHLDRLAVAGAVFDWHFADVPDTAAARHAWQTARHPFAPAQADADNLLDLLVDRGVKVWESDAVASLGLAADFAAAADALLAVEAPLTWPWELTEDQLLPYFEDVADQEDAPRPVEELRDGELTDDREIDALQRTFAAAVTSFDTLVGLLLEELDPDGQALVIVTAGHGQMLGEHGTVGSFGPQLRAARIHLPLIVRLPGGTNAGHRISALTQSVDLLPTLLDAFGVPVPGNLHGRSLLPLVRGETVTGRPYLCLGAADGSEWAIRTPKWYFWWPQAEAEGRLFRKPDDRWEVNDLRQQHLEWADHLKETARRYVEAASQPGPLVAPPLGEPAALPAR